MGNEKSSHYCGYRMTIRIQRSGFGWKVVYDIHHQPLSKACSSLDPAPGFTPSGTSGTSGTSAKVSMGIEPWEVTCCHDSDKASPPHLYITYKLFHTSLTCADV